MDLPKSWADITVKDYHKLITILNVYNGDVVERQIKLLSHFSGQTEKEIEKMKITELKDQVRRLDFLQELPDEKVAAQFILKEKKYRACILTEDMKAGQFIDFSNAGKGCPGEELPYHMHELIACMCQLRTESGWEYIPYDKTMEDFLDMPMSIAYPYFVFFCNVLINLQQPILDYFLKTAKEEKEKAEKILVSA